MDHWRRDGVVTVLVCGGFCQGGSPGDVWWKSLRGKGKSVCRGSGAEESGVLEEQLGSQRGWDRVTE